MPRFSTGAFLLGESNTVRNMAEEASELQKHLAKLIMPEVEKIAKEKYISKHSAYYLFLGMYPRNEGGFTKRELALLRQAFGMVAIADIR